MSEAEELADLRRKADSSRWIFKQAIRKIVSFPSDLSRRIKRSRLKRRSPSPATQVAENLPMQGTAALAVDAAPVSDEVKLFVGSAWEKHVYGLKHSNDHVSEILSEMLAFQESSEFKTILDHAIDLDPNIASANVSGKGHLPPWFDNDYYHLSSVLNRLPQDPIDSVILVPFGKMGGADYVAGLLSHALAANGRTLILRTDLPDWDRPDWYADEAMSLDVSEAISNTLDKTRSLFVILQFLNPKSIYNVNSRLCFDMFQEFGKQLADQFDLYAYYFCADYTPDGHEAGYPIWYVADILPNLKGALCDTAYLRDRLVERYQLPAETASCVHTLYTPVSEKEPRAAIVESQIATAEERSRPRVLWAGRLDRQKRFDLVQEIARRMPDVDFMAWGKAVLDAPPDLDSLPGNLVLHSPFKSYDELPLHACDGWLYTSEWDGLPTILIEVAGMGVPIVASAVGGVPELISEDTGWPVAQAHDADAYVTALRDMLGDPDRRRKRASAAQALVHARHSVQAYHDQLHRIGGAS